ncbi:MAG: hypothetical protein Q7V88_10990 [Actinomycetota bacterium]|nr:hypothetical protein [Actinomycetota bacterium]
MDLGITGRSALVVGPDDELGAACRRALAAEGVRLATSIGDGEVDILVAHSAAGGHPSLLDVQAAAELHQSWNVVVDTLDLFRAALPAMASRGWGRFVFVGAAGSRSLDAIDAIDEELDAITSLAMRAAQKVLAAEAGPANVTANSVLRGGEATADEVAAAVTFLCSEGAGYITGVSIDVAGGVGSAVY